MEENMAKQGSKGGGKKGQRVAKKASYQARKAGSSRKGKNKKQTGGVITMKNKARKQKAHAKRMDKAAARKDERLNLLEQVKAKYPNRRIGDIQKQFGVLNINRMTDILDDSYHEKVWYLARVAKKEAEKERSKEQKKRVKKNGKFAKRRKNKNGKDSRKVQKVHA